MSISIMNAGMSPGLVSPPVSPTAPARPIDAGAMDEHLARALGKDAEDVGIARPSATPARGSPGVEAQPSIDSREATATPAVDRLREAIGAITGAQRRLDSAIELARSGKSFSPQELLALQARTHRFAHDLNLVSKAVEQVSGGIKKTLDTQV